METAAGHGRASHLLQLEEEEGEIGVKLPRPLWLSITDFNQRATLCPSSLSSPVEVEGGGKTLQNSTGKQWASLLLNPYIRNLIREILFFPRLMLRLPPILAGD